jgi:hypothetical protein
MPVKLNINAGGLNAGADPAYDMGVHMYPIIFANEIEVSR